MKKIYSVIIVILACIAMTALLAGCSLLGLGSGGAGGTGGSTGNNGTGGKSAFEIFKEYHPDYEGTEEEWLESLKGEQGARGTVWYNGTVSPKNADLTDVMDGDFYLLAYSKFSSKTGYAIYKLEDGEWILVVDMSSERTDTGEYTIANVGDMKAFREAVNEGYDFAGKTVTLETDLDWNGIIWAPIGTSEHTFRGTFDGGNHTISSIGGAEGPYCGFFSNPSDGRLINITFEKCIFNYTAEQNDEFIAMLQLLKKSSANNVKCTEWVVLMLGEGTFHATANEQFRLEADNAYVMGKDESKTILDAGEYSCSGQAGFEVSGNNCGIGYLTLTSTAQDGNVSALKVTNLDNETDIVENFNLEHVTISSEKGHGLNLHGVDGAILDYLTVTQTGKCGISLAKATDVKITNSTLAAKWASIGFMYSTSGAYQTHSEVMIDFDSCTFEGAIYSERPTDAPDGVDVLRMYDGTDEGAVIDSDNAPEGWQFVQGETGTWAMVKQEPEEEQPEPDEAPEKPEPGADIQDPSDEQTQE